MALILYIDTAATHTHVALANNDTILASILHEKANEQALMLNTLINQLLLNNNFALNQIDALAVDAGPGSYTGLRVGLGVAKGLAFALDKKLLLFNKLNVLIGEKNNCLLILKARNGEGFAIAQQDNKITLPAQHIFYEQFDWKQYSNFSIITDDIGLETYNLSNYQMLENTVLDLEIWNKMAQERFNSAHFDNIAYAEPFYLKSAFTTTPKKLI